MRARIGDVVKCLEKGGFGGVSKGEGEEELFIFRVHLKFFTQVLLKISQSTFGRKFSGKVRLIDTRLSGRVHGVD